MEIVVEIREWIVFFVLVFGGTVALYTYIGDVRQRKLENSLRLLDIFKNNLRENDIQEWAKVFHSSSEPSGARVGSFFDKDTQLFFTTLFCEGPPDNGAVDRIVGQINQISYEILRGTAEVRIIYLQIGQLMTTTYEWISAIPNYANEKSFPEEHFPEFDKVMKKYTKSFEKLRYRVYEYCG